MNGLKKSGKGSSTEFPAMNEERMNGAAKASTDSPGVIVFPAALLLGTMLQGILLNFVWPLHFPRLAWVTFGGGLLFFLGVFMAAWGRRTMMRAGTNVPPHKPTITIVTDGPFRFKRNPLYFGGTLAYIGLSLVFN